MATLRRKRVEEADSAQEENAQTSLGLEEQIQDTNAENPEKVVVRKKRVVKVKPEESAEEAAPVQEPEQTQAEPVQAAELGSENNPAEEHNYKKNQSYYNNKRNGMNKRGFQRSYPTPSGEVSEAIAAETAGANEDNANKPRLLINDLTRKSMPELRELAMQYGFTADDLAPMKKQDLIFVILKAHTEHGGIIFASGALEILPDGYGFLRSTQNSYLPGPDDI